MHTINHHIEDHLEEVQEFFTRFAPLSLDEIKWLSPFFELRSFKKKEVILHQGETELYLNLVLKGLVRKYIVAGKKETTLQLATEKHLIQSEGSFHLQQPSEVVIESLEETLLLSIRYDHVQYALENFPGAEEIGLRMITYMYLKKNSRYYLQLKKSTRERFLDYVSQHPHMLQRVPQKILASYLNIKPETFSRLKHLVRKG